jgi:hypothetical protein
LLADQRGSELHLRRVNYAPKAGIVVYSTAAMRYVSVYRSSRKSGSGAGLLACIVCAGLAVPAVATGRRADVAATRAFLGAAATYANAAYPLVGARIAAMEANEREVAAQCPSAFLYAPRDAAFEDLGEEMSDAEWYAGLVPVRSVTEAFAQATGNLSWSNRRLTRLVRSQATEERAYVALVPPDVCSPIEAWKTSDYAELPPSVGEFLTHVEHIESGSFGLVNHLLRRYEGPAERRTAKHVERLEAHIGKRMETASEAIWRELETAMGVSEL